MCLPGTCRQEGNGRGLSLKRTGCSGDRSYQQITTQISLSLNLRDLIN